jgi:hypothetical protein
LQKKAATTATLAITIPKLQVGKISIVLVGDSALTSHKWSEKTEANR